MFSPSTLRFGLVVGLAVTIFATALISSSEARPRLFLFRKRVEMECPQAPLPLPVPAPTPTPPRVSPPRVSTPWPMFGGTPQRNMVNLLDVNIPAEWKAIKGQAVNIKWAAQLGSKALGTPVVVGGRVFIGTNNDHPRDPAWIKDGKPVDLGALMCFRESDGAFLWQAVHEKLPIGAVNDWPRDGIMSTPAVEGDRLYYVSNRCELICADVNDGRTHWKLDMIKTLRVFPHNRSTSSPLIIDDLVYIVTGNGVDGSHVRIPAPHAPSFLAVNKETGAVVWQNNAPTAKLVGVDPKSTNINFKTLVNRGEVLMHGQWSSPAYGVVNGQPQVVFPGGDGWLYAFTPRGELLWRFDCNPKDAVWASDRKRTRSHFMAAPVIHKDRVYIGVGEDPEYDAGEGHLWCIDMTKRGDVSPDLVTNLGLWPVETQRNSNSALIWHYGGPITTKEARIKLGRDYYFARTLSTCAIHDGLVYAADLAGWFHCLDADTGKAYWTHDTQAPIWSSPYVVDGKVYLGTDARDVHVFQHGKQMQLLARNEVDGRVRSGIVAASGVLYVTAGDRLYAIARPQ